MNRFSSSASLSAIPGGIHISETNERCTSMSSALNGSRRPYSRSRSRYTQRGPYVG